MTVTVCIITRDRPRSLELCLACLEKQTHTPSEVLVVDNSTGPETEHLLGARFPGIRYIHHSAPLGCQPILRNIAIKETHSDILIFTDDDGYPDPQWVAKILECYSDPSVGAVGGRIIQGTVTVSQDGQRPVVGVMRLIGGPLGNFNCEWDEPFDVDHLQGTNMSFRRQLLLETGGWDMNFSGGYASFEEADVCLQIKRLGYRVVYNPRALVKHGLEERISGFGREIQESPRLAFYYSRGGVYLTLKHFGFRPVPLLCALVVNPVIDVVRCLTLRSGRSRIPALSPNSVLSAGAVVLGAVAGVLLLIRTTLSAEQSSRFRYPYLDEKLGRKNSRASVSDRSTSNGL